MTARHPASGSRLEIRLAATIGLALLVFVVLSGVITYAYFHERQLGLNSRLQEQLVRTVSVQAEIGAFTGNQQIISGVSEGLLANPSIMGVGLYTRDGFRFETEGMARVSPRAITAYPLHSPVNPAEQIGELKLALNAAVISREATEFAAYVTGTVILGVLLAVAIVVLILRSQVVRPITRLSAELAGIHPGESTRLTRLREHRHDEIGHLTDSANTLLDATETALNDARQVNDSLARVLKEVQEKEASKSHFFAAASHDLRQPIHAMRLFIDALKRAQTEEQRQSFLANVETASRSLSDLLDKLLNMAKLDAGAVRPAPTQVSLEQIFSTLANNFSPLAQEKGLRFKLWLPAKDLTLHTDRQLLDIVLANLVGNAIKNTDHGGVLVGVRLRGDHLVFQVWDTGIGIAAEYLERIYDEFFQISNSNRDRRKGLGLGLAIARRISALLGYTLSCRSRPGRGTLFEVALPRDALQAAAPDSAPGFADTEPHPELERQFSGKHVVVLEDDELAATALSQWLGSIGCEVSVFARAEDALADSATEHGDYFIVDHQLAGTLDGFDFLRELKVRHPGPVRAVVITGNTSLSLLNNAATQGWPVLFKPAAPQAILTTLSQP